MPRMKRKKAVGGETRRRKSAAGPGEEVNEATSEDHDPTSLNQSLTDLRIPLHKKIKINEVEATENLTEVVNSEFQGKTIESKNLPSNAAPLPIPILTKEESNDNIDGLVEMNEFDRLRELLEHRKMLLNRIRQTQAAAQKRIETLGSSAITGDEEIAKYAEQMKNVNALIRKQQAQEPQEKRPVGRRSSSVRVNQPKMNTQVNEQEVVFPSAGPPRSLKRPLQSQAPKNRPKRTQPRVICPETTALREKRDELRRKILELSQKRRPQDESPMFSERRRSSMSVASPRPASTSRVDHSHQNLLLDGTGAPPHLPSRRKTHWDVLLQEMKWLATDIREERKWKLASAKLVGDELLEKDGTPPTVEAVDATRSDDESMSKDVDEVKDATMPLVEDCIPDEDVVHARGVAARASELIDKCLSGMGSRGGSEHDIKRKHDELLQSNDQSNGDAKNGCNWETCSRFVDETLNALGREPETGRRSRSELYGLKLTEFQEHVVLAVEDRWQRIKIGVCVRGPLACGKTVCACSLLWRNREAGPQIVVCSPGSMLRWAHEIERFSGLRARFTNRINSSTSFESGDVLLCGYSGLSGFVLDLSDKFHTVILDSRHPSGFRGSGMNEDIEVSHDTPDELLQTSWWTKMASFSKSCNRIILGRLDASLSFLQNGSNRQRLSILGLQLGLLIGVSHFYQGHGCTLEKSILGWGRSASKKYAGKESKYRKVLSLFSDVIDKCCVELKDGNRRHSSDEDVWDIRLCEMPELHRIGYCKSCREVSAILARDASETGKIAKALLVLRQNCVFDKQLDTEKVLKAMKMKLLNISQPDVDAANTLLIHSGKFQELLSILVFEFGLSIPSSTLKRLPFGDKKKLKTKGKAPSESIKRIAILAVSTEVQLLVSALFCHLGILHHLLWDDCKPRSQIPWVHHQSSLRAFNEHGGDDATIVIAPPWLVGGDHVGLGIERADAILCIEDDWSGRGELIMQSLTQRNRYRRDAEGLSICRFINLASKDSIEESLLKFGSSTVLETDFQAPWPDLRCLVDAFGVLHAPRASAFAQGTMLTRAKWENGQFSPSLSSFPARNIFLAAHDDLEDLLCSRNVAVVGLGNTEKKTLLSSDFIKSFASLLYDLTSSEARLSTTTASISTLDPAAFALNDVASLSVTNRKYAEGLSRDLLTYLGQESLRQMNFATNRQLRKADKQNVLRIGKQKTPQKHDTTIGEEHGIMEATSLLFYRPKDDRQSAQRSNLFTTIFSLTRPSEEVLGQIGEPLIYFPPLFPLVKECSVIAQANVDIIQKQARPSGESPAVRSSENKLEDMTMHGIVTEEEATHSDAASVLIDLYDDYGLAGLGAISLPRDSALAAADLSATTNNYQWSIDQFESKITGNNFGEGAMVLLTSKKRKRGLSSQRSSATLNGTLGRFSMANGSIDAGGLDISQQSNAVSRSDHTMSESHRQKLLSNLRRCGMGCSMFEAPIYRVASVRIRNRVAGRLMRQDWRPGPAYDAGPGLPLVVAKHPSMPGGSHRGFFDFDPCLWTSIVKRIQNRNARTGAEAIDLSTGQRAALRRSLVAPSRVDFGPFQCGFLSETSGLSLGAPPRNKVGVALPMGVKISSSINKEHLSLPWTPDEDRLLHAAAERFCLNWVVAAAELSGSQDVVIISHAESPRFRATRAARSCRDRWQRLVRSNPSMLIDVRQSERFTFKPAEFPKSEAQKGKIITKSEADLPDLLIPTIESSKKVPSQHQRKRRTFNAFRTSQARTQQSPLQIPGITPGSNATIVPSHQSHEQNNCKPDLCPLHILDPSPGTATGSVRSDAPANRR